MLPPSHPLPPLQEQSPAKQQAAPVSNIPTTHSFKDALISSPDNLSFKDILTSTSPLPPTHSRTSPPPLPPAGFDLDQDLFIPLSTETLSKLYSPWANSIILKIQGKSFSSDYIQNHLKKLWKLPNASTAVALGKCFYTIKFPSHALVSTVLNGGPWFINGSFIAIRRWEPGFRPSEAKMDEPPIWVDLPELPVEFHRIEILKLIGNFVGTFVRADVRGAEKNRAKFARICVILKSKNKLPFSIWLGNFKQELQLAQTQKTCALCKKIGNGEHVCEVTPKQHAAGTSDVISSEKPESLTETDDGWTTVTRKNGCLMDTDTKWMDISLIRNWEDREYLLQQPPTPKFMNTLAWNARGIARPSFKSNLIHLISCHNPDIVILSETTAIIQNELYEGCLLTASK